MVGGFLGTDSHCSPLCKRIPKLKRSWAAGTGQRAADTLWYRTFILLFVPPLFPAQLHYPENSPNEPQEYLESFCIKITSLKKGTIPNGPLNLPPKHGITISQSVEERVRHMRMHLPQAGQVSYLDYPQWTLLQLIFPSRILFPFFLKLCKYGASTASCCERCHRWQDDLWKEFFFSISPFHFFKHCCQKNWKNTPFLGF